MKRAERCEFPAQGVDQLRRFGRGRGNLTVAVARPRPRGRIYVVGTSSGGVEHLTERARQALGKAEVVVGYRTHVQLLGDLLSAKEVHASGMCREATATSTVDNGFTGRLHSN